MLHLHIYVKLETRVVVYAYIYMESHNIYWPVCVMPGDYIILDNSQYNQQAGRTPKVDNIIMPCSQLVKYVARGCFCSIPWQRLHAILFYETLECVCFFIIS